MEIDQQAMRVMNMKWEEVTAESDPCLGRESCLGATEGKRKVLRFDTKIWNRGNADVSVGETPFCPSSDEDTSGLKEGDFVFDTCHWHWHYDGYAAYTLMRLNKEGTAVDQVLGRKTGFCLLDWWCPNAADAKYECLSQGISVGCHDLYAKDLNCQWVDMTDMFDEEARYKLVVEINSLRRIKENNYINNAHGVTFKLKQVPKSYVRGVYLPENQCPLPPDRVENNFSDVFNFSFLNDILGDSIEYNESLSTRLFEDPDLLNCPEFDPHEWWCRGAKRRRALLMEDSLG